MAVENMPCARCRPAVIILWIFYLSTWVWLSITADTPAPELSLFQLEKLECFFNFFNADGDGNLIRKDLDVLFQKILDYTRWAESSPVATELYEVHETFFNILKADTDVRKDRFEISDWMSFWERMISGSIGEQSSQTCLRGLPRTLFKVMDTNIDGSINADEIQYFYEWFAVKIPVQETWVLATLAFNEMTADGLYPLTIEGYEQIFANFLFGRTRYRPERYIFGCFGLSAED